MKELINHWRNGLPVLVAYPNSGIPKLDSAIVQVVMEALSHQGGELEAKLREEMVQARIPRELFGAVMHYAVRLSSASEQFAVSQDVAVATRGFNPNLHATSTLLTH